MLPSFMSGITADQIIAAASSITAVGILLLLKQIRDDHERSRCEKAINLLD
jgi:hypothetical protein